MLNTTSAKCKASKGTQIQNIAQNQYIKTEHQINTYSNNKKMTIQMKYYGKNPKT